MAYNPAAVTVEISIMTVRIVADMPFFATIPSKLPFSSSFLAVCGYLPLVVIVSMV